MESKQRYTEERNDLDVLRSIVNMVLVTDINATNRSRYVVEGRMIYAKILREYGYSLNRIGCYLKKDHTTVIHYTRTIDKLIDANDEIVGKYAKCREMFILEKGSCTDLITEYDLKNEIFRLNNKINVLIADNNELSNKVEGFKGTVNMLKKELTQDDKRLNRIVKFIDENTPIGHEFIVERKIIKMFDE